MLADVLDRVLDEFGLIVCGWSAEWDTALRDAIYRAKSRRYTMFWAVHGELRQKAKGLIADREGYKIPIEGADSFFQSLAGSVESIGDFARPHPLSIEVAVATAKRLLPNEQDDIRLHDLVNDLAEDVVRGADDKSFSLNIKFDDVELNRRMRRYGSLCEKLVGVAAVAGYWSERRHSSLWTTALQRLTSAKRRRGNVVWLRLSLYPATLLLYSIGIGAVARKKLHLLAELLALPTEDDHAPCIAHLLAPAWAPARSRSGAAPSSAASPLVLRRAVGATQQVGDLPNEVGEIAVVRQANSQVRIALVPCAASETCSRTLRQRPCRHREP